MDVTIGRSSVSGLFGMQHPGLCFAALGVEGIAATTPYVLVDLSAGGTFPHDSVREGAIILYGLYITAEKASDGCFDLWFGVVVENDASDGTVKWFKRVDFTVEIGAAAEDRLVLALLFPYGLDLEVNAAGTALVHLVTNQEEADSGNWQNDTARASPAGNVNPGVGDLVLLVEEVTDGGTLDLDVLVAYETKA